ncbi:MAG: hypothetical protein Q9227_001029 [Pyrenula ochraceoflavens]
MSRALQFVLNRFYPPQEPKTSFEDRTVLVTGANVGLGFEAAKKYVELGCTDLVLAVRTVSKGEAARDQILSSTEKSATIRVWQLDMSSFDNIQHFAKQVNEQLPRLDVALLNAGVVQPRFVRSPEGWEETLQVNYLSTALLGLLLLPKLLEINAKTESMPHLSFVSSSSHKHVNIGAMRKSKSSGNILAYWNDEKKFPGTPQYGNSKVFLEFAKAAMANLPSVRSPDGKVNVIINSSCPGFCQSDLARNVTGGSAILSTVAWIVYGIVARTTEQGSRTLVSSTTQGVESHGKFWFNDHVLAE